MADGGVAAVESREKRAREADEESSADQAPAKRARVDEVGQHGWMDGNRGRALLGLAIGVGARYFPDPLEILLTV